MFKRRTYVLSTLGVILLLAAPVGRSAQANGGHAGIGLHRGGPAGLLFRALKDLPLTDAQRAQVQQLQSAARARFRDLAETLAAQVEDGRINRVALQPKVAALKAGRSDLERLHAILAPEQREQLVNGVKARMASHVRKQAGGHRGVDNFLSDLQLTDEQRARIAQAFRARFQGRRPGAQTRAAGARLDKVLEAFKADRFVMSELLPPKNDRAPKMGARFGAGLELVLPVLTPQQRATLAQKIRARVALPAPAATPRAG